jgi:hypothetical protein
MQHGVLQQRLQQQPRHRQGPRQRFQPSPFNLQAIAQPQRFDRV